MSTLINISGENIQEISVRDSYNIIYLHFFLIHDNNIVRNSKMLNLIYY